MKGGGCDGDNLVFHYGLEFFSSRELEALVRITEKMKR